MTDKEILEAVKAEINRRMDELYNKLPDGNEVINGAVTIPDANITGKYTALESILHFIKTLQVEPATKDYRERYKRIAESEAFKKTHEGMSIGEVIPVDGTTPKVFEDMLNAKTAAESLGISSEEHDRIVDECIFGEEPVSEDLEVELNKYIKGHFTIDKEQLDRFGIDEKDYMYSMDKSDMLALVEHFTNWQKTKEGSVSEDFEEANKEWLRPQFDKSYANYGEAKMMELTHFDGYAMFDAIEFGAKWQKEQMMAKAGNGRVNSVSNRQTRAHITVVFDSPRDIEVLDRLKVIVIKED